MRQIRQKKRNLIFNFMDLQTEMAIRIWIQIPMHLLL